MNQETPEFANISKRNTESAFKTGGFMFWDRLLALVSSKDPNTGAFVCGRWSALYYEHHGYTRVVFECPTCRRKDDWIVYRRIGTMTCCSCKANNTTVPQAIIDYITKVNKEHVGITGAGHDSGTWLIPPPADW
jgi:hypothetical protein